MKIKYFLIIIIALIISHQLKSQSINNVVECSESAVRSWVFDDDNNFALILDSIAYSISHEGNPIDRTKVYGLYWTFNSNHYYSLLSDNFGLNPSSYKIIKYTSDFSIESETIIEREGQFRSLEIFNEELITTRYDHENVKLYLEKYSLSGLLIKSIEISTSGTSPSNLFVVNNGNIVLYDSENLENYIYVSNDLIILATGLSDNIVPTSIVQYDNNHILIAGDKINEDGIFLFKSEFTGKIVETIDLDDDYFWTHDINVGQDEIFIRTEDFYDRKGKIHMLNKTDFEKICTAEFNIFPANYNSTYSNNSFLKNNNLVFGAGYNDKSSLSIYEGDCLIDYFETKECSDIPNSSTELSNVVDEPHIFPNPTNGPINIVGINSRFCYEIFDIQKELISKSYDTNEINIEHLPPGIYFINVFKSKSESNFVFKIIKI